jgi:tetratricopeptide (TPR) repeat protein
MKPRIGPRDCKREPPPAILPWLLAGAVLSCLSVHAPGNCSQEEAPQPAACDLDAAEARVHQKLAEDQWRNALEESRRCHRDHPDDPRAGSLLGQVLFRAGHFDEVDQVLSPIVDREAAPPRALLSLARLRDAEGRRQDAAALLRRATEAAPADPWVHYWAADIASSRDQRIALLERYLELCTGDDPDRIDDARGTLGVLNELGQRAVWVPVRRPERVELPLRLVWDPGGAVVGYVVEARAGPKGKPVELLLDTGSSGLYVIHRVAKKRDVTLLGEATTFGGKDRRQQVQRGFFSSFALGNLRYESALVTSTREELDPTGRFHGLLGLSPLGGYKVTLDLARRSLLLEPPGEPIEGARYWIIGGQILVEARADGAEPGLFLLDTGAGRSLLAASYVEQLEQAQIGPAAALTGLGGAYGGARVVRGVRLRFQGLSGGGELSTADLSLRSRSTGVEISGYLGLEVLDGARIVIDTTSQTIQAGKP